MKKFILTFMLSGMLFLLHAQQTSFQLLVDISMNDDIADVVETASGDFVAVSTTNAGSNYDITIIKFSATGILLDAKTIGTTNSEFARSICATSDGGYFITGSTYTVSNDYDALLIKVDSAFNVQFFKRYGIVSGNDYANRGFEIIPGNYTFTGTVAIGGSAKPAIVTLNDSGDVISEHYLNTNQFASPDYHGNYLGNGIIGFAHLSNMMALLDTAGNIITNFNFTAGGYSTRIILSNDNRPVALGLTGIGGPHGESVSICKGDTSSGGNLTMTTSYSYSGYNVEPAGIFQDASGNYFIAGNLIDFSNGYSNPFVMKTDSSGAIIWSNNYRPSSSATCQVNCIIPTSDGGCMIAGNSFALGNTDYFIAKIDSGGSSGCNTTSFLMTSAVYSVSAATAHTSTPGNISPLTAGTVTDTTAVTTPDLICLPNGISDQEDRKLNGIKVYPTIFDQYINIELQDKSQMLNATITDLPGRIIYSGNIFGNAKINPGNIASGQYILRIESSDRKKFFVCNLMKTKTFGE